METADFKDILFQKGENGLVTVVLNRPERKNAMSPYTFVELFWAIDAFEKDDDVGAMIITGANHPDNKDPLKEAFSSGGYFNEAALSDVPDDIKAEIDLTDLAQKRLTLKMFQCDKPIIAAINGLAIGAGFTMPFVGTDLIYLSEHAWIRLPFANLGIVAELASSFLLPRYLGFQKAKELVFFSQKITAQEALELRLVNAVVSHDRLLNFAREQALRLVPPQGASLAIRSMKRSMHQPYIDRLVTVLDLENEGLNACIKTTDFGEALIARMEKREPIFTGK